MSGRRRRGIARSGRQSSWSSRPSPPPRCCVRNDDTTRVATTVGPSPTHAPASSSSPIVPCGSRLPTAIPAGRPEPSRQPVSDPSSVHVRIYVCRLDRFVPEAGTRLDGGGIREAVTTLRELMDRFGGLTKALCSTSSGESTQISLAPLVGEDPDTTALDSSGLLTGRESCRRRRASSRASDITEPQPVIKGKYMGAPSRSRSRALRRAGQQ